MGAQQEQQEQILQLLRSLQLQHTQQQQILALLQAGRASGGARTLAVPVSHSAPDLTHSAHPPVWGSFDGSSQADDAASPVPHKSLQRKSSKKMRRKSLRAVAVSATVFPVRASAAPTAPGSPQGGPGSRPAKSMATGAERGKEVPPIIVGRLVRSISRFAGSPKMSPIGRSKLRPTSRGVGLSSPLAAQQWGKAANTVAEHNTEVEEAMRNDREGVRKVKEEGEGSSKSGGGGSTDVFLSPMNNS